MEFTRGEIKMAKKHHNHLGGEGFICLIPFNPQSHPMGAALANNTWEGEAASPGSQSR